MSTRIRFGFAVTGLVGALVLFSGYMAAGKRPPKVEPSEFAQSVDLTAWSNLAVHAEGRVKSFDSFANEMMAFVTGPRKYQGQTPTFTYLDLMLSEPGAYADADVLFVKNKSLRHDIIRSLTDAGMLEPPPAGHESHDGHGHGGPELKPRLDAFSKWGLLSPRLLDHPAVKQRLNELGGDLMRSARFVQQIESAQFVAQPRVLYDRMTMLPPANDQMEWVRPGDADTLAHVDAEDAVAIEQAWVDFQEGWKARDAAKVNVASATIAGLVPGLNPALYPEAEKLAWESWYFAQGNLTWIWMVYLLSVVILLFWFVYRWKAAGWLGMSAFVVAFLLHTGAIGLRWWVSGRWPNSNMFEAVTTAAWMGGAAAVVLEIWGRKTAIRKLFALTSGTASMVALMCAHYMPLQLNPNIGNMMPVLHNVWLYVHTNVIIWSYILIFMASVSGMLYLLYRMCGGERAFSPTSGMSMAVAGSPSMLDGGAPVGSGGGPLPDQGPEGPVARSQGLSAVLDGVTMDLMKLSFVMLWAGLVMGAIWADHSWGRPWGWDPKEVFALCTFLVFAVLVHVRWKTKDKGLWTAVLAVIGCAVMLFNWIVINFLITGLHSYA